MKVSKIKGIIYSVVTLAVLSALTASPAHAVPIQWTVGSGGNGHFYELIIVEPHISWSDAQLQAAALGGYLATITSQAENDFIATALTPSPDSGIAGWLGGLQNPLNPAYSEPGGGWEWITGESFGYTNWFPGEPSDSPGNGIDLAGNEDHFAFYGGRSIGCNVERPQRASVAQQLCPRAQPCYPPGVCPRTCYVTSTELWPGRDGSLQKGAWTERGLRHVVSLSN